MNKKRWSLAWFVFLFSAALVVNFALPEPEPDLQFIGMGASWQQPLGYDTLGRPLLQRVLSGSWVSLQISLLAMGVSLVLGTLIGGGTEFLPRPLSAGVWFFVDIFNSIPLLVFIAVIVSSWTLSRTVMGAWEMGLLLGSCGWWTMARMAQANVRRLMTEDFILAARALGASPWRIFSTHIMPGIKGPLLVYAVSQVPGFIIAESFLSFIGLGLQAPLNSWGLLLQEGWKNLSSYPHIAIAPVIFIFFTLLSLQQWLSQDEALKLNRFE